VYDDRCMVLLLFPLLICALAAVLLLLGVALVTSMVVAIVLSAVATWLLVRAYRSAKKRSVEDWRSRPRN
jgi:membrane protein implicated in regulation of membrane protease activity